MDTNKFKTRTMMKIRDNGDTGDKWCVALDIGYSSVKTFSPNMISSFPAYAKKETAQYVGDISKAVIRYKNTDTGECWTVGDDAQERMDVRDTNESENVLYGRERYLTPMFKVILETGIALGSLNAGGNAPNGRELFIQTGLPPKYIKSDRDALIDVLKGRHRFSITIGNGRPISFDFTLTPDNVDIIAQPMGTLFSVMVDREHKFTPDADNYMNKNVLIFDPGFGTLDLFPVRAHHIENSETFDNLGMKRVIQETVDEINEKYEQNFSVPIMQKFLGKGTFRYQKRKEGRMVTKDIPFDDILAEKSRQICLEALQTVEQVIPLTEYDYMIITGGTSAAWSSMIRDYFSEMSTLKIVDGNHNDDIPFIFANVRGYFMYRYNLLVNTKK